MLEFFCDNLRYTQIQFNHKGWAALRSISEVPKSIKDGIDIEEKRTIVDLLSIFRLPQN